VQDLIYGALALRASLERIGGFAAWRGASGFALACSGGKGAADPLEQ